MQSFVAVIDGSEYYLLSVVYLLVFVTSTELILLKYFRLQLHVF